MSKLKRIEPARVELLPPAALAPRPDPREMLEELHRQVAEVLANRDELLMRPFFDEREISYRLKNLQTVPYQRKMRGYFQRHGCLYCHKRHGIHRACAMCQACYGLVRSRMRAVVRDFERDPEAPPLDWIDQEKVARKALKGVVADVAASSKPRNKIRPKEDGKKR